MNSVEHLDNTPKTAIFDYVFVNDVDSGYENLGTGEKTGYYLAPPDLLRYCISNANISGLFAYSGVSG